MTNDTETTQPYAILEKATRAHYDQAFRHCFDAKLRTTETELALYGAAKTYLELAKAKPQLIEGQARLLISCIEQASVDQAQSFKRNKTSAEEAMRTEEYFNHRDKCIETLFNLDRIGINKRDGVVVESEDREETLLPVSELWPTGPVMGHATRRQLRGMLDNPGAQVTQQWRDSAETQMAHSDRVRETLEGIGKMSDRVKASRTAMKPDIGRFSS